MAVRCQLALPESGGHDAPVTESATQNDLQWPKCVVNCAVYRRGVREDITLDRISDVLEVDDSSFVWVGLYEPEEGILEKLQEEFALHDLAIEDAQHAHQRPKAETYGNSLFIVVHTAQLVEGHVAFGETHAFLGARFLVTIRHGASLSYTQVRERFEREPELLKLGPAFALYGVLDFIVDNYIPIVNELNSELDSLEQDIFSDTFRRETILKLYSLKKELTQMRLAVAPLQDILAQLTRTQVATVAEETKLHFRDVLDHVLRLNESIDTLREMLSAAMSMNLSLVTVNQGEVVKKLAGWAGLLAAPTLIASWYGMNFVHIPELEGRYSYFVVIGVTFVVCVALYRYLKKVSWL